MDQPTQFEKNISKEANEILKQGLSECVRIGSQIPNSERSNQNEVYRTAIARKNLIESAELSRQIVQALDNGALLLSLIGQRALVESYINTKYTFAHPNKENKIEWAYQVCRDYFDRGNNPVASKNRLNEEGIAKRAEEVALMDIYEVTYGGLCNFGHMLIHSGWCNVPETRHELMKDCYVGTITLLHDIRLYIQKHFEVKGYWDEHETQIVAFKKKYPCTCSVLASPP